MKKKGDQNLKNLHPRLVALTSVSSGAFIDDFDLVLLSQIKQELESSFLSNKEMEEVHRKNVLIYYLILIK
ncbi:hypothetical protein ACR1PO_03350 [Chryseobacterium sp. RRHN12]|uniref:hypothetical protein n=1 Tax=Chryseobacterium sp. RRHN12 TaxID=3437884 RepID=UPI003D9BE3F4